MGSGSGTRSVGPGPHSPGTEAASQGSRREGNHAGQGLLAPGPPGLGAPLTQNPCPQGGTAFLVWFWRLKLLTAWYQLPKEPGPDSGQDCLAEQRHAQAPPIPEGGQ